MLTYAMDNPSPTTIILISGDHDFAYAVSTLRLRHYVVVVIGPSDPVPHISLESQASVFFDWHRDILGMPQIGTRIAMEGDMEQPNTPPSSNFEPRITSATLATLDATSPFRTFEGSRNGGKPLESPKFRKKESSTKRNNIGASQVLKQPDGDGKLRKFHSLTENSHSPSSTTVIMPAAANIDWAKGTRPRTRDSAKSSLQCDRDGHQYEIALDDSTSTRQTQSRTNFECREPTSQADARSVSENGISFDLGKKAPNSSPSVKPEQMIRPSFGLIKPATYVQPSPPVTSVEQPNCEAHSADPAAVDSNTTCKSFDTPRSIVSQPLLSVHDPGNNSSDLHNAHRVPAIPINNTPRTPPFLSANETTSSHGEWLGQPSPSISPPVFQSESTETSHLPVGITPPIVSETALLLPILAPPASKSRILNNDHDLTMPYKPFLEEFRALVEMLEKEQRNGNRQVLRSKCAYALVQRDQMVYKRAGVKKFSEYAALAEKAGLIQLGGTDGGAWISLPAEMQHLPPLSGPTASSNNPDTTNGANGTRGIQVARSPSGPSSWTAYKIPGSANMRPGRWQPETSTTALTTKPATFVARPFAPSYPRPNALPFSPLPSSTRKLSSSFTVKPLVKTVPDEFTVLVQLLEKESLDGNRRVLRSKAAIALVERDQMAYKRAGVERFSQYASLAETAGIVELGGRDGGAWISLRSDWQGKTASSC
jgi:hypothetical protein